MLSLHLHVHKYDRNGWWECRKLYGTISAIHMGKASAPGPHPLPTSMQAKKMAADGDHFLSANRLYSIFSTTVTV